MIKNPRGEDAWIYNNVSSPFLFISGFIFSFLIILQKNLFIKSVELLILLFLLILFKKSIKLINSGLFFIFIIFFNCLSPAGKVLLKLGKLVITQGALITGLRKALDIISLFYLSRLIVRKDLILPGKLGLVFTRVFFYLNSLFEYRDKLDLRKPIESIDSIILDAYGGRININVVSNSRTTWKGALVIVSIIIFGMILLFF